MLAVVSSRARVESFWAAMQENDWHRAAGHGGLRDRLAVSGERIVGRENFAAIQSRYPTYTGRWSFDVHRIVAEEDTSAAAQPTILIHCSGSVAWENEFE
jgi:limonene-1,2-epoxide hydrolase